MTQDEAYAWLTRHSIETSRLASVESAIAWDQRTCLPPKGHAHRAEQLALLTALVHERSIDPRIGERLADVEESALAADPTSPSAVNIREWRRAYDRAVRIPVHLAEELARATANAETVWERARPANDWPAFSPHLDKVLGLLREKTDRLGWTAEPYDALLEDYEPKETAAGLAALFDEIRAPLIALIGRIAASPVAPDRGLLCRPFPVDAQARLSRSLAAALGFDFEGGRLDASAHPFTIGLGPGDVRITTRYNERLFGAALFGTIHETGHALYEQGLPAAHWGTPLCGPASLGVHESQSRLWENMVGRSAGFWRYALPLARAELDALADTSLEPFLLAVNAVSPSLNRVEADEVTYNLHILLRFELERSLLKGELETADLPGAWNEKMRSYLGVEPSDFKDGVMQDVHWSAGLVGYFPTYTLGNLYAAELFAAAERDLGALEERFARGEFGPLLDWLREKIHARGATHGPRDLIREATGGAPSSAPFIRYLEEKYAALYLL